MDLSFTTRTQDAISGAVRRASRAGHAQVEPVHLLEGLLEDRDGIAAALLANLGVDHTALMAAVSSAISAIPSASGDTVAQPSMSNAGYRVIAAAQDAARERGDEYVSTEHLLLALAADRGDAGSLLRSHGDPSPATSLLHPQNERPR